MHQSFVYTSIHFYICVHPFNCTQIKIENIFNILEDSVVSPLRQYLPSLPEMTTILTWFIVD